jgi:hypothetical protein
MPGEFVINVNFNEFNKIYLPILDSPPEMIKIYPGPLSMNLV